MKRRDIGLALALVALLCTTNAFAQTTMRTATANPLLAIDQHRASVVERILDEWGDALAQSDAGITRAQLREMLDGLRADQLLAATLVNTLDEVLRVVREPGVTMGAVGQHYVAITPTEALELRAVPGAQAYLVRDGETVSVVKPAALQLTGRNRVVGYFTADSGPSVTTVIQEKPLAKDGSGSGANSWIGYTAGGNVASGSGSAVAAGTNNVASGPNAFVGAGTFNAATAQGAFVGGGTSNVANATSALVMGGFDNQATVIDSLVVAGAGNRATGARSVVVGGGYNLASGQWSFIGGGGRQTGSGAAGANAEDNVAAGDFSTIGGGQGNRTNNYSAVGGGRNNIASGGAAIVGGGWFNTTSGSYATVGGGSNNIASGLIATVAGGQSNTASGTGATVAGGFINTASGFYATMAGGKSNTASGQYSFVGGGNGNVAAGVYSVALGLSAKATFNGCFVWSDSSTSNGTGCFANNEFVARAVGGYYFWTSGNSDANYAGARLAANTGAWAAYSDRNGKDNVEPVNPRGVLEKLASVPIATWKWKNEDARHRHMGPMAQDFYAAFGLGADGTHIVTVDADGVALAAIQGLNAKVEEQRHEIAELRDRVSVAESLRGELAALKAALAEALQERRVTVRRE